MSNLIQRDLSRIGIDNDCPKIVFIKKILKSYSFHVLYFYRLHKMLCGKAKRPTYCLPVILMKKLTEKLYGIHINPTAEISAGLYIGHFGGIRIGYCSIGENCNINQQVSIGSFGDNEKKNKVVIGKQVWIGAHSKILPGVSIGDSVTISAGTVVDRDLPSFCLVSGENCRIISTKYDNSHLLNITNNL